MNEQEEWRPVVGYEGFYEVSNLGRVRSIDHRVNAANKYGWVGSKIWKGKILACVHGRGDYLFVNLSNMNRAKQYPIHRLVAFTFVPNQEHKPHIDHIDGNRHNNRADNLRWCTCKENINNPVTLPSRCKRVLQFSKSGELLNTWPSTAEAVRVLGIHHIDACCRGIRKTAGGYKWKYENEQTNNY